MSATRQLDQAVYAELGGSSRSGRRIVGQADIAYRVGKSQQIIGGRFRLAPRRRA